MEDRDYCLRKTVAWSIEDQLAVKRDLASRAMESITAIHEVCAVSSDVAGHQLLKRAKTSPHSFEGFRTVSEVQI